MTLSLSMGERVTLLFLLSNFQGDRTSSAMRKTKRIKHAMHWQEVPEGISVNNLLDDTSALEAELDRESLAWLWDTFQQFKAWPTQLDEWVPDLEDKLRAAVATSVKA